MTMNSLCPWPPDPLTGHPLVDSSFSTYPCRTQESSGPLPAPSLLAVHIPHVSPVPVAWPPFHPGLLPKLKPCPARRGVAGVQSYLLKWQHQRSWALISPTPLPNQPPILPISPSHSLKNAFSFLSPYSSPQLAINPSLGTF